MNLGSIYGAFDYYDRSIIIRAMHYYSDKSIKHNTICFLDTSTVLEALRAHLNNYYRLNGYPYTKRLKRLVKLLEGIS